MYDACCTIICQTAKYVEAFLIGVAAHWEEVVRLVPDVGTVEAGLEWHPHHGALGDEVLPQPRVLCGGAVGAVCQHRQHAH